MRFLKSKLFSAMLVGGLMFSLLNFTTTPVSAQDTASGLPSNEENAKSAIIGTVVISHTVAMVYYWFYGTPLIWIQGGETATTELPPDALDQF